MAPTINSDNQTPSVTNESATVTLDNQTPSVTTDSATIAAMAEPITLIVTYLEEDVKFIVATLKVHSFAEIRPILSEYELYEGTHHPPYIVRKDGQTYSISDEGSLRALNMSEITVYLGSRSKPFLERIKFINKEFMKQELEDHVNQVFRDYDEAEDDDYKSPEKAPTSEPGSSSSEDA